MTPSRAHALFACCLMVGGCTVLAQPDDAPPPQLMPIVFFPPTPPIYGAAIDNGPPAYARVGGRRMPPPDGMADFVSECFYPALSTRLFAPELSRKLEVRLEEYRAKRRLQISALLDQLLAVHDVSPDVRERELRAFASAQTPLLVALEAEAEQLREALVSDGLRNEIDWNAERKWKLGALKARHDWADREAEFQVVRAAAFYEKGLVVQQRGLLRELAMELQPLAQKARGQPTPRSESDAMFFSPEMTRFRLSPNLTSALRDKIATYNSQKAVLKRQLREVINAHDRESAGKRAKAFEALAEMQWPHFGILEELADEIRAELATRPETPPPAPPWIPAGLMETISSYNEDRDSYFGELRQKIDTAAAMVRRPNPNAPTDERVQEYREFAQMQAEARRLATIEFQNKYEARFIDLERRYKTIREALTVVAEKQIDRATGRPLNADTLLRQYGASIEEFDAFGRQAAIYTNYRIAMLQPGLSPEQRRLLFGYALVGLAQPLPYGELMPRRAATQPVPAY